MQYIRALTAVIFLIMMGCATAPKTVDEKPDDGQPTQLDQAKAQFENDVNSVKKEEDDEIEAREAEQNLSLEKRVDALYDAAYEGYLSGAFSAAITSFESARLLNSEKMLFWRKRALSYCYIATGQYKKAENLSLALVKEKPQYWGGYMNVAMALLWQGKVKKATEYFLKAEDFKDAEPIVHFYLGVTYDLRKIKQKASEHINIAIVEYKEIIQKNPSDEQAFFELAYLYLYQTKNLGKAEKLLASVKEIIEDSDNAEKKQLWVDFYLPHLHGILEYKKGNYHPSILALTQAIAKAPAGIKLDLAEIYYYLGKNYLALNDKNKAINFYKKATDLDTLILYRADIQKVIPKSRGKRQKRSARAR